MLHLRKDPKPVNSAALKHVVVSSPYIYGTLTTYQVP